MAAEERPEAWPEYRLLRSRRVGQAADMVRNVAHLLFDQMRSPTPSEHHFERPDVQARATEWLDKLDMQDATEETAAEADFRECGDLRDPSDEAWERGSGW